jgi:RNA polymerase sigma-70 factor (ECF subfamily)
VPQPEFRQLFAEQFGFVWRVLQRHGVPARELEDGCQEVFLVVFRRVGEFERRSSLRTWIYGIAVRVAIGMRRRAYRRRELLTDAVPEAVAAHEASSAAEVSEARALLEAALNTLPRAKREVFVLYELESMTMAEVAHALGIPEGTALYRLYRAREEVETFMRRAELRSRGSARAPAVQARRRRTGRAAS